MIIIFNDVKYLNINNISFYKNRIYYNIGNIRINGLYIQIKKNIIEKGNKYKILLDKDILIVNDLIGKKYKEFINDINNPSIEISKNSITEKIYNNNQENIVLKFMSINDNNYPRIHILQCPKS